jgi:hypothetical protein
MTHQSINKIRMLLLSRETNLVQKAKSRTGTVLKDEKLTKPTASDGAVVAVLVRANQE